MNLRAHFYSKRDRNLAVLAGVALLTLVLALVAVHTREAMLAPRNTPQTFLPGVAHALNAREVTHIHIESKKGGTFDVTFEPSKGWVLPQRADYPASFDEVKKALVAIAAMETVEPKTDDPQLFHYVDLDAPPKGDGIAITLSGDKGVLTKLIIGKSVMIGDDSGIGLFVRKANESQSWLVKSPSEIKASPSDWMDKTVVNIDRSRVARVDVRPAKGPAYTVSRNAPGDESFAVSPLPKGRELAYAGVADSVASAITDFSFEDIQPAASFDFSNAAHMTVHTFDGLDVTVEAVKQGDATWARLIASSEPGMAEAAKEALAINNRAGVWAYKLQDYKAAAFAAPLETLLKPAESKPESPKPSKRKK
jgi:hypothetical protein